MNMTTDHPTESLVRFFKALAEPNRLKIVGLLAQKDRPVEEVASLLGIGVSTASHHLSRLAKAGLVSARAEGYYSIYSLHTDMLRDMARTLLKSEDLPRLADDEGGDPLERKVLATFTNADGSIRAFPVQEKKFLVLVRHALKAFEPGVRYTEKRVNQILKGFNEDTARLRRAFVDHGFMKREGGGGMYWREKE
jgi:predicted transcriptional regulator